MESRDLVHLQNGMLSGKSREENRSTVTEAAHVESKHAPETGHTLRKLRAGSALFVSQAQGPEFDLQDPSKNLDAATHAYNPSSGEEKTGRSLGSCRLTQ